VAQLTAYESHRVHRGERVYFETNCYTDVLVELLHARGYEPLAALGCLVRMDFEGDQFTFFKPLAADLERLFAVDVHEMQPYRPLPAQIEEQLEEGRTMIVEVDSWFLPDTRATSYRQAHVKTSIAAAAIDVAGERLTYFHNAGRHELDGDDFRGVLRLVELPGEALPPYTELVRFDAGTPLEGDVLRDAAREATRAHLERRPPDNPFNRFAAHLERRMPELTEGPLQDYHDYAFATVRMAGAASELAAAHVEWLLGAAGDATVAALLDVVAGCRTLSLKLARRRAFDVAASTAGIAERWDAAMTELTAALD
jgi:hypothetical protein